MSVQKMPDSAFAARDAEIASRQEVVGTQDGLPEARAAESTEKDVVIEAPAAKITEQEASIAELWRRILGAGEPDPAPEPESRPESSTFWRGVGTVWPTAATTGPRILTTAASRNRVSGIVKGKKFTGTVYPANGTEFEDCEFSGNGGYSIDGDGKRFKVTHCRFACNGQEAAILGNADVVNCDISNCKDGIKPQGSGWTIRGNFIHDPYIGGVDPHNDGIQASGGHSNCLVEQNYVDWRDTSAVFFHSVFGPVSNCTVQHNWLGGADMPLRIDGTGCKAIENMIERGQWGDWDFAKPVEHYGNITVDGKALD